MKIPRSFDVTPTRILLGIMLIVLPIVLYNRFKSCDNCGCNSYQNAEFISFDTEFNDTIQKLQIERTVQYLLFCKGGFAFGQDDDEQTIDRRVIDFIIFGETVAVKRKNDNLIKFINNNGDSMLVRFKRRRNGHLSDMELIE